MFIGLLAILPIRLGIIPIVIPIQRRSCLAGWCSEKRKMLIFWAISMTLKIFGAQNYPRGTLSSPENLETIAPPAFPTLKFKWIYRQTYIHTKRLIHSMFIREIILPLRLHWRVHGTATLKLNTAPSLYELVCVSSRLGTKRSRSKLS